MADSMSSLRVVRILSTLAVPAIAFAAVTLAPRAAQAQYVVVQSPPPPPPPPPPRAYVYPYGYPYGYPPPPPRPAYYYVDREPLYALALGADLEGAVPVGVNVPTGDGTIKGGGGFKVRLGEQFRLIGARFTPEVGFGYDHLWANDAYGNTYGWDMNRLFVGARLSFGRILVPVIYAHVGYGWRQTETNDLPNSVPDQGGLAYDFGGALDLRVVPHFGFGVHLEYAAIDIPTQPQWIAAGLHADIIF